MVIPALPFAKPTSKAHVPYPVPERRLDLGLLQGEVADRLGVTESSVTNWELSHTEPELRFLPGIVGYLGYTPWSVDGSSLRCSVVAI